MRGIGVVIGLGLVLLAVHAGLALLIGAEPRELRHLGYRLSIGMRFSEEVFRGGDGVYSGQRWGMLLTHGFRHVSWLHLAVNLGTLALFGPFLVRRTGARRFLWVWFGTMAVAAVGYGLAAAPGATMVGASGATHGVAGALAVLLWRDGARGRAAAVLATVLAMNAAFWWGTAGRFAWELHVAGWLAGMGAGLMLRRR
ncbi:MAG: rhomboid family intramembrane serine protease [Paracoccaceae bacterium]|nr:MAG: rhomboid family intramembrane serine protease [Paracoccaceae bacterium]